MNKFKVNVQGERAHINYLTSFGSVLASTSIPLNPTKTLRARAQKASKALEAQFFLGKDLEASLNATAPGKPVGDFRKGDHGV